MKHYHEEEIPIEEDFNPWDENCLLYTSDAADEL